MEEFQTSGELTQFDIDALKSFTKLEHLQLFGALHDNVITDGGMALLASLTTLKVLELECGFVPQALTEVKDEMGQTND